MIADQFIKYFTLSVECIGVHIAVSLKVDGYHFFDPTRIFLHNNYPVGQGDCFPDIVSDKNNGMAQFMPKPEQQLLHFLPGPERQVMQRVHP